MATSDSTVAQRTAKRSKQPLDIDDEVAVMQGLSIGQLRDRYAEVYGEASRSRHKMHLIRKVAWRMQALAEGDLSERARHRAEELANDADIRVMPPKSERVDSYCFIVSPLPSLLHEDCPSSVPGVDHDQDRVD